MCQEVKSLLETAVAFDFWLPTTASAHSGSKIIRDLLAFS